MVEKGDIIDVWWKTPRGGRPGTNKAMILDILPYTGRYKEFFNCVLVLEAENTRTKTVEMAYKNE